MVRLYYALAVFMAALVLCGPGFAGRTAFAQDSVPADKLSQWNAFSEQERDQLRGSLKAWKQMSDADRQRVLDNYARFKAFDPEERRKVMENYNRFISMDALQRKVVRDRYKKWNMLSPEQRSVLSNRYQMLLKMQPADKSKFYDNYQTWMRMTAQEQENLLSQWNSFTEAQKKAFTQQGKLLSKERLDTIKKDLKTIQENRKKGLANRALKADKAATGGATAPAGQ
jgi:uncharacterized protein YfbU (UPF0304 family)